MLGCMIVDHFRPNFRSRAGMVVMMAVTDTLLTKLMFEQDHLGEGSDALYMERIKRYSEEYGIAFDPEDAKSYYQTAMVPIGMRYGSSEEDCDWGEELGLVKKEARMCLKALGIEGQRALEGELLASLIFLGKGGASTKAVSYFIEHEYAKPVDGWSHELSHILTTLAESADFVEFLDKACIFNDPSLQMLCGGLGQVFFNRLPAKWVDNTLDDMDYDQKNMLLSFLKRFECLPSW